MDIPASSEARFFYRCALQRHDDALVLLRAAHTTGAVYLAGQGVECILKALLLAILPAPARVEKLREFRGTKAHDDEWLRTQYLQNGGSRFPREITLVNDCSTAIRNLLRSLEIAESQGFLSAAERIILWADGRL